MLNLLLPHPAALVKTGKTKTLLIADLHIGWEMELQQRGIHVPSQTSKLLAKLTAIIAKYKPDVLMILGDVKYSVTLNGLGEWQDIPYFFSQLQRLVGDVSVIRGNHDANLEALLPENVKLLPAAGAIIGDVGVFHGHKWPSPALLGCKSLVMGHLHPMVVFRDPAGFKVNRQVWLRINCKTEVLVRVLLQKYGVKIKDSEFKALAEHYKVKAKAEELLIMPSFNDFLGGRPVNESRGRSEIGVEDLIGPVLRSEAVDVNNSELYLLDGTYLGTLNQLRNL